MCLLSVLQPLHLSITDPKINLMRVRKDSDDVLHEMGLQTGAASRFLVGHQRAVPLPLPLPFYQRAVPAGCACWAVCVPHGRAMYR